MKKAAIFDLDGTLSDSIMSMKYSGDKTMAEFGYGPFSVQDYKYFVGDGAARSKIAAFFILFSYTNLNPCSS
jgi:phosphoglycolate phosphatase